MTIDLTGPRVKIERACEHARALEAEIEPVLNGERHRIQLSAEFDPDSGYHIFRIAKIPHEWRSRLAVMLGDIVHNLRSALDQIAWQLVINHSGRPTTPGAAKRIKFPIETDRQRLARTDTFIKVSPADQTIIERVQSYNGSGNPKLVGLMVLERLSNQDKHRVLNPILLSTRNVTFKDSALENSRVTGIDAMSIRLRGLKVGAEFMRGIVPMEFRDKIEVAGYVIPNAKLPQGDYWMPHGITAMIRVVEWVVEEVAEYYGV